MQDEPSIHICILATSDIHGHIYPTDYRDSEDRRFGLAKLATIIEAERTSCANMLLIDNGDLIQGSPLTYHYAKFNRDLTHPAITALNHLRYDAAVIGNHEFNYGPQLLNKAVKDSHFPWLAANIVNSATGESAFGKPYLIKIIQEEIKVAVLGATTHFIPNWEHPEYIEGLQFKDALSTVKAWVEIIRRDERPDVLVVAYHGGFERALSDDHAAAVESGENQGIAMLSTVEGIDVLITGHQHLSIAEVKNGVAIVQPSNNGQSLGKVSLELTKVADSWVIRSKEAALLRPDKYADQSLLALLDDMQKQTQEWLDQPLGTATGDLTIHDPFLSRVVDHPFIEFLNRVQMDAAGVGVSCAALFSNESKGFGERITMRDILSNYMFPNTLKVLRLSGQDIKDALEKTAEYFILDSNGDLAVNPAYLDPKPQHYNYDMWEGIEYQLDISNPPGERVTQLRHEGRPLDMAAQLDVVMNNYRAAGGGDYFMFQGKTAIKEIQTDMAELLANYMMKHQVIHATCDHNWSVTGGRVKHRPL